MTSTASLTSTTLTYTAYPKPCLFDAYGTVVNYARSCFLGISNPYCCIIQQDINHMCVICKLCAQICAKCMCVSTLEDAAVQQKTAKTTQHQQCFHMQSKCAGRATSMRGLARDESLLAYLSVYSI